MTKKERLYKGEETVSSTNDAGTAGQLHIKNETRSFFSIIHKNKLKKH